MKKLVLSEINPNLNFGMSILPQSNNTVRALTYGKFYGLAVLRSSRNPQVALSIANILSNKANSKVLAGYVGLPSARRDVLTEVTATDPFAHTKAQSAIMSKSWLEPAPQSAVNEVFSLLINNIVSGTANPATGIMSANTDLNLLLNPYNK